MKTKMKQALSFIMALTVTMSLLGCNKSEKNSTTSTVSSDVQAQGPTKVTFFARFTNIPSDTHNDPVIKALEKATNLDITFIANPSNNYQERLQIMLASSDYPDLVSFSSHTDKAFLDAVNNGVVVPINQYLEKAPELKNAAKQMSWDAMKVKGDDNIYGVPQATAVRFDGFIVRKDWTDKLGISIPSDGKISLAEFENLMKQMTEGDPDGNGRSDTFGFVPGAGSNGEMGTILNNVFRTIKFYLKVT